MKKSSPVIRNLPDYIAKSLSHHKYMEGKSKPMFEAFKQTGEVKKRK